MTELFTGDTARVQRRRRLNAGGADPRKTFIEQVKSFPENIETKITMTFRRNAGGITIGPGGPPPGAAAAAAAAARSRS